MGRYVDLQGGHIWLYQLASLVTGVRATQGIHTGSWNLNDMRSLMNDPSYNWKQSHLSR